MSEIVDKIYKNVDKVKLELNILNSLIGSEKIEDDFQNNGFTGHGVYTWPDGQRYETKYSELSCNHTRTIMCFTSYFCSV